MIINLIAMFAIVVPGRLFVQKSARILIFCCLGIALLGLLAGCSGNSEPTTSDTVPPSPEVQGSLPIGVQLFFANSPVMNKTVTLTATFSVGKDHYTAIEKNVRERIVLSEGIQLVSGSLERTEDLARGQQSLLSVEVKTVASGIWTAVGEVSLAGPNAEVVNSKTYYVSVTDSGATVSEEPPEEAPPTTPSQTTHPEVPVPPNQQVPGTPIF